MESVDHIVDGVSRMVGGNEYVHTLSLLLCVLIAVASYIVLATAQSVSFNFQFPVCTNKLCLELHG